jgi:hypothetical protein
MLREVLLNIEVSKLLTGHLNPCFRYDGGFNKIPYNEQPMGGLEKKRLDDGADDSGLRQLNI